MNIRNSLELACVATLVFTTMTVRAVDGTWLGNNGNWSDTTTPGGVWSGGTVADGIDATAWFTGVDITEAKTNTVDVPQTIGHITFIDDTTPDNDLTLAASNMLTLAVSSNAPTINVPQSGRTLMLSAFLGGDDGLTKVGDGTLTLTAQSSNLTGTVTINQGTLRWYNNNTGGLSVPIAPRHGPFQAIARDYTIASNAVMEFAILGASSLNRWNVIPVGTSTICGAGTLRVLSGNISYDNNLFSRALTNQFLNVAMDAGGLIEVQAKARIYTGDWNVNPFSTEKCWTMTNNLASLHVDGIFDVCDGNPVFVDALTGTGVVAKTTGLGYGSVGLMAAVDVTVGVNNGSGTFSGVIQGTNPTYPINLIKAGTGTQTLTGKNTYVGTTTISNGVLGVVVGGSCSNSAVTVANEGLLQIEVTNTTNQWSCSSLALNNGTNMLFNFTAPEGPSTTAVPLYIATTLTLTSGSKIAVNSDGSLPKRFPLLTVGGTPPMEVPTMSPSRVDKRFVWIYKTLWLEDTSTLILLR